MNQVAASCAGSTAGAAQVTARSLPDPCASDGADGAFGIWTVGVGVGVGVVGLAALRRAAENHGGLSKVSRCAWIDRHVLFRLPYVIFMLLYITQKGQFVKHNPTRPGCGGYPV